MFLVKKKAPLGAFLRVSFLAQSGLFGFTPRPWGT
jgi:hypothetical protein